MSESFATPAEYLASLPKDRRAALTAIRKTIKANLGKGFREGIQYGMLGYFIPHSVYPDGYHCDPKQPLPFASVASQKNHMSLYLFCIYTDPKEQERFVKAWKATGKKLDMGKSCVRFKKIEDVPLEVVGEAIARISADKFIAGYEAARGTPGKPARKRVAKKVTKRSTKRSTKTTAKKAVKKTTQRASKRTVKKATRKAGKRTATR